MSPDAFATHSLPGGCERIPLSVKGDERGLLVALEAGSEVQFAIARVYYVYGTKPGVNRGFHAHHRLRQMAVAVSGACTMVLDDGRTRSEVRLDSPEIALTIAPMVWHEMRDFSPGCVLMVLADAPYDERDYVRDYQQFLAAVGA